jgi:membrane associated rhomboid family serine protease
MRPTQFSILPMVVKNLLIINGLCFLANVVLADRGWFDMNDAFGLYYPGSANFKPFQLVTHLFMHGSMTHLLFNMFSLWMFGNTLENYWGPKRFLIYYMVTGLGAAFLHLGVNWYEISHLQEQVSNYVSNPSYESFRIFISQNDRNLNIENIEKFSQIWFKEKQNPEYIANSKQIAEQIAEMLVSHKMNVPVVGASGAVFGLLLGFGMLFPNTELIMLFFPFPIKAKYFVFFYGAAELYQGISNNPSDNVAHFAHLGGMLFGFILIKIWNKSNRQHFY